MNMNPRDFVRTIYLGDRACKSFTVDGWGATVRIQVDCISRIRSVSGTWDLYTQEDIEDGDIVFSGVKTFTLENAGFLPNDLINDIDVIEQQSDGTVVVEMSIESVAEDASHHETKVRLSCTSIHLEDPKRPGVKIEE